MTDARNGTTTYGYNDADLVTSVTTPSPDTGQSAQTTTTAYNTMLQPTNVVLTDSGTVAGAYSLRGEFVRSSGT